MGWKKGQGLGANNQGITERLKVPFKFDTFGKLHDMVMSLVCD